MKLLLVEDNEAIILGLEYLLKEEGFSCQVARTKKEAEKAVSEKSFDLIWILCCRMETDMLCAAILRKGEIYRLFF